MATGAFQAERQRDKGEKNQQRPRSCSEARHCLGRRERVSVIRKVVKTQV